MPYCEPPVKTSLKTGKKGIDVKKALKMTKVRGVAFEKINFSFARERRNEKTSPFEIIPTILARPQTCQHKKSLEGRKCEKSKVRH